MEKIINIGGKDVRFKAPSSFVYRYKAHFGKDVLNILMPLVKSLVPIVAKKGKAGAIDNIMLINALDGMELTDIYNVLYILAKSADDSIDSDPIAWLDSFDSFPVWDVAQDVFGMLIPTLITTKEPKKK